MPIELAITHVICFSSLLSVLWLLTALMELPDTILTLKGRIAEDHSQQLNPEDSVQPTDSRLRRTAQTGVVPRQEENCQTVIDF